MMMELCTFPSVAAQLGIAIAPANLLQQEKQQRRELTAQNQALENAIKFTQTGSVTLRASRDAKPVPSEHWTIREGRLSVSQPVTLRFKVEDTAVGIAPDELSSPFDAFVQTQSGHQSIEGTALGLPISQQFVRLMEGDITARSIVGQESIFTFDIQVDLATLVGGLVGKNG